MTDAHIHEVRIYYEDTDAGGVVYYANYLRYAERARTEWLRSLGIDLASWMDRGLVFVVSETTLALRRPARYGDLVRVETILVDRGAASLRLRHRFLKGPEAIAENDVRLCAVDRSLKPCRMPPEFSSHLPGA